MFSACHKRKAVTVLSHEAFWLYIACTQYAEMATQKSPQFVYQFYPYANYPRTPGLLEWLGIGGLQCLDCGDAPFREVTRA